MEYSDFPPFCFNWASKIFILGLVANPAPHLISICHVSNFFLLSHRRERFLVTRACLSLLGPFTGVVEFVFVRAFSRA